MTKPQYAWPHQQERELWRPVIAAGRGECVEPECLLDDRHIPAEWAPTQLWHLSHDAATGRTIGPSHRRCNLAENARRNNPKRAKKRRRLEL